MANELTDKTHVLVTRLGDFWVNQQRGANIMQLKMRDPNAQFEMDGSYITAPSIDGLLTAQQYAELQNKRRGMWQCKWQQWHNRNDQCFCARNAHTASAPAKPRDDRPPLTEEQRAAGRKKMAELRKRFGKKVQ